MEKEYEGLNISSRNSSFIKKSFISLLAVTISIILLLTIFLTMNNINLLLSLTTGFNQNLLSQTNYSITNLNENVNILIKSLYYDKDIISFLYMNQYDSKLPIYAKQAIDKQLVTLSYVDSVYLYNAELDLFYSSKSGRQLDSTEFTDQNIVNVISNQNYDNLGTSTILLHDGSNSKGATNISYIFFDMGSTKGKMKNCIIINIKPSSLTDSLQNISHYQEGFESNFIVTDENGTIISSVLNSELKQSQQLFPRLKQEINEMSIKDNHLITIEGKLYYLSSTNNNENDWYLISLIPASIIFKDIINSSFIGVLIVVGIIMFSFGICYQLAKRLNRPIQTLLRIVKKQDSDNSFETLNTEEFQMLLSIFQSMKEQNQQLDKLCKDTTYSAKQYVLDTLITNNHIQTLEQTATKLKNLQLSYLLDSTLCMCVFKLDHYHTFISKNNQREQWALRFAILNIAGEISIKYVSCEIFSHETDKFILLIDCNSMTDYKLFTKTLEKMLLEIQKNVFRCLDLTLSVSYSIFFHGLEHISSMYRNMEESLLLRLKLGYNCIINPYMMDDLSTEQFQFPVEKLEHFTNKVLDGKEEQAYSLFLELSEKMYQYSPNEIMSGTIYLAYGLYKALSQKYPVIKDDISLYINSFVIHTKEAEIADDLNKAVNSLIHELCNEVIETKNSSTHQNADLITQRICEIIERKYPDNGLCLSSIAEEIRLSPNYIGQIFKTAKGKSIAQYILSIRMEKLGDYLRNSNVPLDSIIDKVGLEKNNYFYTRFKKHFGVSLSEYCLSIENEK